MKRFATRFWKMWNWRAGSSPWAAKSFSFPRSANGQYILIRRSTYESIGGHEAVRNEVLEDVELARRVKSMGGKILFLPEIGQRAVYPDPSEYLRIDRRP